MSASPYTALLAPRPAAWPTSERTAATPELGTDGESAVPTVPRSHTPPRYELPPFPPIPGSRHSSSQFLRRLVRRHRRALAVCLAATAAVTAVSAARGAPPPPSDPPPRPHPVAHAHRKASDTVVRAPIRIADAAVARLLHPGDRVDVLAAAHVVASAAKVVAVPRETPGQPPTELAHDGSAPGGALIVLSVTRRTAAVLSGAAAASPLGVALC